MKPQLQTILAVLFLITVLGVVLWQGYPQSEKREQENGLHVVTTMYSLENFIKQIGGEHVTVTNVVPAGVEPHDYEPSPRDIAKVLEADVLVYLGGGLDAWAEDLAGEVREKGGLVVGIEDEVPFATINAKQQDHEDKVEAGHDHTGVDPHIWLDPVEAQNIAVVIRDVLIVADPVHERDYQTKTQVFIQKLEQLDSEYAVGLSKCKLNDIIVSHDAFGYLARRYGFTIHPISGISPEAEPSIRDLTRLAQEVENLGITTLFFETLVSPKLAETLATEVGATTAVLDPLEGLLEEDIVQGKDYLSVMTQNLQALRMAMICR